MSEEHDSEPGAESETARLPAGFFVHSFAIIICGYMGFYVCLILVAMGTGLLIEGDSFREKFEAAYIEEHGEPEFADLYSTVSAWTILGMSTLCACLVGFLIGLWAPFAKFGHGLFLAAGFFITFLQLLFADEPFAPPWLTIAMLGFVPCATLFGAKNAELRYLRSTYADSADDADEGEVGQDHSDESNSV